jgi:hypothetical protein
MTRPASQDPAPEAAGRPPEADGLPEGTITLAEALARLASELPALRAALDRQADSRPRIEPMALRPEDLEAAIGVDNRTIQRWRSAGKFPKPDIRHGHTLLWRVETVRAWLESGGRP